MQVLALSGVLSALLIGCGSGNDNSDSSGSTDGGTTDNSSSGKVADEWVKAHNKYRRMHQVGDVKWSAEIAKNAQEFVDKCPREHSKSGYGENLARGSGYFGNDFAGLVGYWYSEESKHDYKSNDWRGGISGHFTQVVWKGTTEIGCAYNPKCEKDGYKGLYVCQYNPAGNNGQYTKNVFPPK